MVHKSSKPKGKSREEVVVPVFATLLVKKITEDADGNLSLIGTFIQRPLLYDFAFDRESGNEANHISTCASTRASQAEDCFELRKVAVTLTEGPKVDVRETDEKGYFATAPRRSWHDPAPQAEHGYSEQPFPL